MTGRRPRLLFLATNPREGASTRYRVLQYFSLLEQNGFECLFQPFFSSQAMGSLYQPGHMLRKFVYFLEGGTRRYLALLALKNRVDLIFVHRELFPLGIPFFLKKVRRLQIPTIYDYDDAMFLPQRQDRWLFSLLEQPHRADVGEDYPLATRGRSSDFDLSAREEIVLTVLLSRERYGLEISKAVEEASGGKKRLSFSSLYPTLHRLEKEGLIKSRWGADSPEERGGARRRYYRITKVGQEALREAEHMRTQLATWRLLPESM